MDSQLDTVLSPQALLVARSAALESENDRLAKTLRGDKIDKSAGESQLKTVQARSDAVEQALRGQMATMEVCLQHVRVQRGVRLSNVREIFFQCWGTTGLIRCHGGMYQACTC